MLSYAFTEEQEDLRAMVREFAEAEIAPLVEDAERNEKFPVEIMPKLGELGLLGIVFPEEYGGGHAPGAVNVPLMFAGAGGMSPNPAFLASAQAAMPDKSKPLLVGCKAGPRSGKACAALADAGYTAIMDVQGGWMAWEAAGLPVQK